MAEEKQDSSGVTAERIFDSDTHCVEKPALWTDRLPKAWGDQVMHIAYDDAAGREMWYIGDKPVAVGWQSAFYGSAGEDPDDRRVPRRFEDVGPVCYEPSERLKVMDEWGITTAVLYPNAAGFSLDPFLEHPDPTISAAHVTAYNDYLLEGWVAAAPGRFIPMACVTYWDIPRAIKEVERIAGKGYGGIVTTGAPQAHGQPYLRDRHWDPLWATIEESGLPVAFHVGNGDTTVHFPSALVAQEPHDIRHMRVAMGIYLDNAMQATELLLSGVLGRFPDLRFVISESGVGWVPFMLEACDERFKREHVRLPEFDGMLPSELFRRQVYVNFFFEHLEDWHLRHAGENNIMFQTDIPHPTGFYFSGSNDFRHDALEFAVGDLDPEVRAKVLWGNAATLYAPALTVQEVQP
jgi:predicted TIM-barrel fold metal-dependent hydrolase